MSSGGSSGGGSGAPVSAMAAASLSYRGPQAKVQSILAPVRNYVYTNMQVDAGTFMYKHTSVLFKYV